MSAPRLSFDPARNLTIYFRIKRNGTRVFVFKNPDGTPFDITAIDWRFIMKHSENSSNNIFELTVGDGLTIVDTNKLQVNLTVALTTVRQKQYFCELVNENDEETWINGYAYAHDGVYDDKGNTANLTINTLGNEVVVTVQAGAGGGPVTWEDVLFDSSVISAVNVGGIEIGFDTEDITLKEFITQLLAAPYVNPAFGSFVITGQATTVEWGTTISGSKTFTWAITLNSGTVATIDIFDVTANATLLAGTANDGSQAVNVTTITLTADGQTQRFKGILHDTGKTPTQDIDSSIFTITARPVIFFGPAAATPANSAAVRALPQSAFQAASGSFDLETGSSLIRYEIAILQGKNIVSIIDLDAFNADVTANYVLVGTRSVNDAGGNAHTYELYEMVNGVPYLSSHTHRVTYN